VREKEFDKAAGVAFFIPGVLAAMLAADSNTAIMGMLFLSIGDAAASVGTAGGKEKGDGGGEEGEWGFLLFIVIFFSCVFVGWGKRGGERI